MRSGSSSCAPSSIFRKFFFSAHSATASATAMAPYSTVGFHLMKRSSCSTSVSVPNKRISTSVAFCIACSLRSMA
ncbi:hypothetical protein D3C72_1829410 [compost metagenome]